MLNHFKRILFVLFVYRIESALSLKLLLYKILE